MTTDLDLFATALGATFIAELGDKTQLAILLLAERHRPLPLFFAASLALGASVLLAATLGAVAGAALGGPWLTIVAGLIFVAFGALGLRDVLRDSRATQSDEPEAEPRHRSLLAVVFAVVFIAELGDKTQVATALFASQGSPVWAALGSLTALVASTALAVLLGQVLARMSARARLVVRLLGALVFIAVGVVQLVDGLLGLGAL